MKIEQIYTGCLAQGAYYILSDGEAAIIDPLREIGPYIEKARKDGATIKYVFETHFHADFVSGHIDLAAYGVEFLLQTVELGFAHRLIELAAKLGRMAADDAQILTDRASFRGGFHDNQGFSR